MFCLLQGTDVVEHEYMMFATVGVIPCFFEDCLALINGAAMLLRKGKYLFLK